MPAGPARDAVIAVANDPSTIYWNSAGIASLVREEGLVSQWGEDPPERFLRHVSQ